MIKRLKSSLVGLAAAISLSAGVANATVLTLSNWNTTELQTSNDAVTVLIGNESSGGFTCGANQICVHWVDGVGTDTPTPKAIINFSYTIDGQSTPPQSTSETGGSTNWNLGGTGNNADGFGPFDRNNVKGNGNENTAGTTNWLVFGFANNLPSNVSAWDFAAHVQYNENCSGWVSDKVHSNPGSSSSCYTGPGRTPSNDVPEPSSMMLFGVGLIGLGAWGRKRLK